MNRRGLQFMVAGIPVTVDPSFLIIAVLLTIGLGSMPLMLLGILVIFISILTHELGHAFSGRAHGLQPYIVLYSMGGLTGWMGARRLTPWQSIVVSLSGPFAGFFLAALSYAGQYMYSPAPKSMLGYFFLFMIWINLFWGVLNLLPILPLDGGNVMSMIVQLITKRPNIRIPLTISICIGSIAIATGFKYGYVFASILGIFLLYNNYQQLAKLPRPINQSPAQHPIQIVIFGVLLGLTTFIFLPEPLELHRMLQNQPRQQQPIPTDAPTAPPPPSRTTSSGNTLDGQGEYTYPDGTSFRGLFQHGRPHGRGRMVFPDGSRFVGEFQNGQPANDGTWYSPDGVAIASIVDGTRQPPPPITLQISPDLESVVRPELPRSRPSFDTEARIKFFQKSRVFVPAVPIEVNPDLPQSRARFLLRAEPEPSLTLTPDQPATEQLATALTRLLETRGAADAP